MRDATRSLYAIVGGCSEDKIHIHNASTGAFVRDVKLPPPPIYPSLDGFYCQSLRGDPLHPLNFTALVNNQNYYLPSRLLHFDLLRSEDEDEWKRDPDEDDGDENECDPNTQTQTQT